MYDAISNTSPLLYLYRGGIIDWLPRLFNEVWIPNAVVLELQEGQLRGYDVPAPKDYIWLQVVEPKVMPSEWLTSDLGAGELAAIALALENSNRLILLDDSFARRIAHAAGLEVWGSLRILLEAKAQGLTKVIEPFISRLQDSGMWLSDDIRQRVLILAGE